MHWGELRGTQGREDGKSTCSACPMEGGNVSAKCCSRWGLRNRCRARIVLAYEQLFLPLNFAPTNVSASQQMQNLDFVCMLKCRELMPILQTVLGHSDRHRRYTLTSTLESIPLTLKTQTPTLSLSIKTCTLLVKNTINAVPLSHTSIEYQPH